MTILTHPSHPGEVLEELYLKPLGISPWVLERIIGVPHKRIRRLVKRETNLNADTAIRLSQAFSTTPEYWLNMARAWELARARQTVDVSSIKPLVTT